MSSDGGSNNERKRPATENIQLDEDDDTSSSSSTVVIGLNVGGKVFFTQQSTLTYGSSYFQAKFSGKFHSTPSYIDSQTGWKVYFVDANPVIFEIILDYLRRGVQCWPEEKDDALLYRRLLREAQYFGVDSMVDELRHRRFFPNTEGKGIMYWLGTQRGVSEYRNPYEIGAVQFSGTCNPDWDDNQGKFVEHRPLCDGHGIFEVSSFLLYCDQSVEGKDLIISLPNDILVRPSHYSLRYGMCYGMDNWNFEGSADKSNWDILHLARSDESILQQSDHEGKWKEMKAVYDVRCNGVTDENEQRAIATDLVEKHARNTWEVSNTHGRWYRHFRILGAGEEIEGQSTCLHGVGFEIYGTVVKEDEE